jgi:ArsR family transcriptional regulator, lead/cadmium/zinc/bismuth-responsive transcriptional repressor
MEDIPTSPLNVTDALGGATSAQRAPSCEEIYIHEDQVLRAQAVLVDGPTAERLATTFQAMADPTRLRLISALCSGELCVCDLAALLGMTQSAISHQLRILRDLRLVKARKEGRIVYYSLDDDHIRDLYLRSLEHLHHG